MQDAQTINNVTNKVYQKIEKHKIMNASDGYSVSLPVVAVNK